MYTTTELYWMKWHHIPPKEYKRYLKGILDQVSKKLGLRYFMWEGFADEVYEILFDDGHICIKVSEYSLWSMEERIDEVCEKVRAEFEYQKRLKREEKR